MNTAQALRSGRLLHFGSYRIERVLGQGGFGITYLAIDTNLEKKVAIKEFFPKNFCNRETTTNHISVTSEGALELVPKLKAKFIKEAKNIAKLDHPNIIKIFAAFEENNTAYYVMDFIEGMSLSDKVKLDGPLDEFRAYNYVSRISEALTYIHGLKINHLDVKPANIMVRSADDVPILIDFGLSKQYDADGVQTSTTPIGVSHGYAPLEQYNTGGVKEFSPQTDVYSLAATLYYLLTGVTPPQATMLTDEELTFPPLFPEHYIAPITKAMSISRKSRYATVQEFMHALVLTGNRQGSSFSGVAPRNSYLVSENDATNFPQKVNSAKDSSKVINSQESNDDQTAPTFPIFSILIFIIIIIIIAAIILVRGVVKNYYFF